MLLRPLIVRSGGLRPPAVALAGLAVGAAGAFVASTEQAEAVSPVATRTPHALYVWGGNEGEDRGWRCFFKQKTAYEMESRDWS
eukprot:COSAG05_NODE_6527_length_943_cov_1.117299_1_plen_83_part_01